MRDTATTESMCDIGRPPARIGLSCSPRHLNKLPQPSQHARLCPRSDLMPRSWSGRQRTRAPRRAPVPGFGDRSIADFVVRSERPCVPHFDNRKPKIENHVGPSAVIGSRPGSGTGAPPLRHPPFPDRGHGARRRIAIRAHIDEAAVHRLHAADDPASAAVAGTAHRKAALVSRERRRAAKGLRPDAGQVRRSGHTRQIAGRTLRDLRRTVGSLLAERGSISAWQWSFSDTPISQRPLASIRLRGPTRSRQPL